MKKRILAFFLCALIVVSTVLTFVSCGGKDDKKPNGEKYDAVQWLDNLGDHDLGGYTVKFAVSEAGEDTYGFNERSIAADADTGDKVDAKIHLRNEAIKARFNCGIELTYVTHNPLSADIAHALMGQSSEYDVIAGRQYDDVAMCVEGYFVNVLTDSRVNKYISIGREYWGKEYTKDMSYGKNVYWLAGDLNLRYTGGFYGVFVNSTLYDTKLKDEYGDIHDVVRNNKWTVGLMKDMSDKVTNISTANPNKGNITESDILGVAAPIHDNTNGWAVSCGVTFSKLTKSGNIKLTFKHSDQRLRDFYEAYLALVSTKGCISYGGVYLDAFQVFKADRALFVPGRINQAELYLRDMVNDYYIIPNPMLNEEQAKDIGYRSSLHDAISIYAINDDSENIEATAIVLEAMAAESYRSVRTEYYDNGLKNKYTTSPDTAEMIEIINAGAYSDFALVWCLTPYFPSMGAILRSYLNGKKADISEGLIYVQSGWQISLDELKDKFDKLAEIKNAK